MSRFAEKDSGTLIAMIRARPLATLVVAGDEGPEAFHVPMIHVAEGGPHGTLRGHVAGGNALRRRDGAPVLAIFQAADAYVSPAWYPSKAEHGKVVPTWNYAVAHARGRLRVIEDRTWLRAQLEALTRQQESARAEPWHVADAPAGFIESLLGAIVGLEVPVAALTGIRKASQNRDAHDRAAVAAALAGHPMAAWMPESVSDT